MDCVAGWRCWASAVAVLAGCGPSTPGTFTQSDRQLVLAEENGARLSLVNTDGQRAPFPAELSGEVESVWALDGELLVASSPDGVWTWDGTGDEAAELSSSTTESRRLSTAPDDRYLQVRSSGTLDVANYRIVAFDLLDRTILFDARGCGNTTGYFSWQGDGPEAVMLDNTCMGLGELVEYSLRQYSNGESTPLFDVSVDDPPRLRMSPRGDVLYVEYAERWSLYDLSRRAVVHEASVEQSGADVTWLRDGSALLRVEGRFLVRYDTDGSERWRTDLGIKPVGIIPSPVGSLILVRTGDCNGGSCLDIIDGEDGSDRGGDSDRRIGSSSWARHGRAIILAPFEEGDPWVYMDLEAREWRDLTPSCGSPTWAPDTTAFVCPEACNPEQTQVRLRWFDGDGFPLADGPCGNFGQVVWSPDSDFVAVAVGDEETEPRVHLMDRSGRSLDLGRGTIAQAGWRPGEP